MLETEFKSLYNAVLNAFAASDKECWLCDDSCGFVFITINNSFVVNNEMTFKEGKFRALSICSFLKGRLNEQELIEGLKS